MLASAVNSALQSVSFPNSKPRLLLVSDSYDRLKSLEAGFNHNEFDISTVCSLEELVTACDDCHDMVALDVSPDQIAPMLKQIRASASHRCRCFGSGNPFEVSETEAPAPRGFHAFCLRHGQNEACPRNSSSSERPVKSPAPASWLARHERSYSISRPIRLQIHESC